MYEPINVLQVWEAPLRNIVTKAYLRQRKSGRGEVVDKQHFTIPATT